MNHKITISDLKHLQHEDNEWTLIDVRKQVDFGKQHQLYATCIPLNRIEDMAGDLLPCLHTRIILVDDGFPDQPAPAESAAEVLGAMGYMNVTVLEGGVRAWAKAGHELYSGINVLSKAFGEFVLDSCHTPLLDAVELLTRVEKQEKLAIFDVRPWQEFSDGTIPNAQNVPGAEIVYRLNEIVSDPATEIVVTCGGRTRSIIGAQSLINVGVPNRVYALENGTLGWKLAGLDLEKPQPQRLLVPSVAIEDNARHYAARLAEHNAIKRIDLHTLETWYAGREFRTTYIVDVRLPEEFQSGHLEYAKNVPGGQLIQTTDEHLAVKNGRVVLVDDIEVRAMITASWLLQMGWTDVYVLKGGIGPLDLVREKRQRGIRNALQVDGITLVEHPLLPEDEAWQDACEREDATDKDMQAYIDWEVALLEQVKREDRLYFKLKEVFMNEMTISCAKCPHHWSKRLCNLEEGKGLDSCPTLTKKELLEECLHKYEDPATLKFAQNATIQEGVGYQEIDGNVRAVKPRLLEIAEFADRMDYKKLGFIFCEGLVDEAKAVDRYLGDNGFEVVSIVCKAGRTPKERIGVLDKQKIMPGTFEPMCNPIYQAGIVNNAKVDFNILMGLCVGHDSLVIQHLEAPVTILAAKDRVLGHNPLAAVYNMNSYYAFLK